MSQYHLLHLPGPQECLKIGNLQYKTPMGCVSRECWKGCNLTWQLPLLLLHTRPARQVNEVFSSNNIIDEANANRGPVSDGRYLFCNGHVHQALQAKHNLQEQRQKQRSQSLHA